MSVVALIGTSGNDVFEVSADWSANTYQFWCGDTMQAEIPQSQLTGFAVVGNGGNDQLNIDPQVSVTLTNDPGADGTKMDLYLYGYANFHDAAQIAQFQSIYPAGKGTSITIDPDGTRLLEADSLTIDEFTNGALKGRIDLNDNAMIIHNPDATTAATVEGTVEAYIENNVNGGYASGAWNGFGIDSTTAANSNRTLLATAVGNKINAVQGGAAASNIWFGQRVSATDVLLEYTFVGDANLDGLVNVGDLGIVSTNYGTTSGATWAQGDVNYDGKVDVADLGATSSSYDSVPRPVLLPADEYASYSFTLPGDAVTAKTQVTTITSWTVRWGDGSSDTIPIAENQSPNATVSHPYDGWYGNGHVISITANGQDSQHADASFEIPHVESYVVPTAATDLSVTQNRSDQVDLWWSPNSLIATSYHVWASTGGAFSEIGSTSGDADHFSASGLLAHTAYTFKVTADNSEVEFNDSDTLTATPIAADLSQTGDAQVAEGEPYELTLRYQPAAGETATVDHWEIDWNDGTSVERDPVTDAAQPLVVQHTFSPGASDAVVTVTAVTAADNSNVSTDLHLEPTRVSIVPTAPTDLVATAVSYGEVDLTWSDNSACESSYTILRSDDGGLTFFTVGSAAADAKTFSDSSVDASSGYLYKLFANGGGSSNASTSAISNPTNTPSSQPSLSASPGLNPWDKAVLTWTYAGLDGASFELELEDETIGENFHLFALAGAVGPSHTDTMTVPITAGDTYLFRIRADHPDGTVSGYSITSYQSLVSSPPGLSVNPIDLGDGESHVKLSWAGKPNGGSVIIEILGDPYPGPTWRVLEFSNDNHTYWPSEFYGSETGWWYSSPPGVGEQGYVVDPGVLGPGHYQWRIQYNAPTGQPSDWSAPVSATIGDVASGPSLALAPGKVGDNDTSITASWDINLTAQSDASFALYETAENSGPMLDVWDPKPGLIYTDGAYNDTNNAVAKHFSVDVEGLSPGTRYYFTLWTTYDDGVTLATTLAYSSANAKTTGTRDVSPPAAPAFMRGAADPNAPGVLVHLYWGNSSNDETGFDIYRSDNGGAWQKIKHVDADVTSFDDRPDPQDAKPQPGLPPWPWTYRVVAVKDALASSPTSTTVLPVGGVDITANLIGMSLTFDKDWWAMTQQRRLQLALTLVGVISSQDAWDVTGMKEGGLGGTGLGAGTGWGTCTVNGKVYHQKAVNYYLAGLIYRELLQTFPVAADRFATLVTLNTLVLKSDDVPDEKLAWFYAGAFGGTNVATIRWLADVLPGPLYRGKLAWHVGDYNGAEQ